MNLVDRSFYEMKKWVFGWWDLLDRVYSFPVQNDWFHFRLVAFDLLVASLLFEVNIFQSRFYVNWVLRIKCRVSLNLNRIFSYEHVLTHDCSLFKRALESIDKCHFNFMHPCLKWKSKKVIFLFRFIQFCSFRTLKTVFFVSCNKLFKKLDVIKAKDK